MARLRKPAEPDSDIRLVGYARVSTLDQRLDLQLDALRAAGVMEDNLHVEKLSANSRKRPALDLAIMDLRPGDTLLVWRLDRLARSMRDLYARLDQISGAGAGFKSLTEHFDFSTANGRLLIGLFGIMAEFERQLTVERTIAGMRARKDRGQPMGAPRKMDEKKVDRAERMLKGGSGVEAVAEALGVAKSSVYKYFSVKHHGLKVVVKRRPT